MIFLDRFIFGTGKGLGLPFWDQTLYWLVDAKTKRGTLYTLMGGFGAQLHSIQWTHPKAQEERILAGVPFRPFNSYRRWGRVRVAWAMKPEPTDYDTVRALESRLGRSDPGPWPSHSAGVEHG